MGTLARDQAVTPGVAFPSSRSPTRGLPGFARPRFPATAPCKGPCQAGFCPCTLRRISDPPEPTFGHRRYLFGGVPPQPNRPPAAVPLSGLAPRPPVAGVSWAHPRGPEAAVHRSPLRCARGAVGQRLAAVKLHGVSPSHRASPAFPREWRVQGALAEDSGGLVTPFAEPAFNRQGITLP